MESLILLAFGALLILVIGGICGLVANFRANRLQQELADLRLQVNALREQLVQAADDRQAPPEPFIPRATEPRRAPSPPAPFPVFSRQVEPPIPIPPAPAPMHAPAPVPTIPEPPARIPPRTVVPSRKADFSLEVLIGKKYMAWAGAIIFLCGMGYFLKYAYDNDWIGPYGRLTIGALFGAIAYVCGVLPRFRRMPVLSQSLIGLALAIFYACVFYAFGIYRVWGQGAAFGAAFGVTALGIGTAVYFNAASICGLALIGGFLSPVLLSTGQNRPVGLFSYVAVIDLLAMGCALFRNWRGVNLIAFAGTAVLGFGWYDRFYGSGQLGVALAFLSLFYGIFFLLPLIHSLNRRTAGTAESILLLALDAAVSFFCYYELLYPAQARLLVAFLLGQAALAGLAFAAWRSRLPGDEKTAAALGVQGLALLLLTVPIQFSDYAIPIAWALEGAVLAYAARQYADRICAGFSTLALGLAAGGLLYRLPLHPRAFTPVWNAEFGSWIACALACGIAGTCLSPRAVRAFRGAGDGFVQIATGLPWILCVGLACLALHMEVAAYWDFHARAAGTNAIPWRGAEWKVVLWGILALATAGTGKALRLEMVRWLAAPVLAVGLAVLAFQILDYAPPYATWLMNPRVAAGLFFAGACAGMGLLLRAPGPDDSADAAAWRRWICGASLTLGIVLASAVLHDDLGAFWDAQGGRAGSAAVHRAESLTALWAVLPLALALAAWKLKRPDAIPLSMAGCAFGAWVMIRSFWDYADGPLLPAANAAFGARLLYVLALHACAALWTRTPADPERADRNLQAARAAEPAAHVFLAILLALEILRWSRHTPGITPAFGQGCVSALWSAQALGLIVLGLATRSRSRRTLGFLLFGVAIAKMLLIDTSTLARVYRILSFTATGLLLLAGSYFYHHFSSRLTGGDETEPAKG